MPYMSQKARHTSFGHDPHQFDHAAMHLSCTGKDVVKRVSYIAANQTFPVSAIRIRCNSVLPTTVSAAGMNPLT